MSQRERAEQGPLRLSIAISDYDHVRDLVEGRVNAEGIELIPLRLSVEEIFYRFVTYREWDISELSMAKYVSLISQDAEDLTAIPVFPSRVFRISGFYVRPDSPLQAPKELRGLRVGIPEWSVTATVYGRAYLVHQEGIPLTEIEWIQGGVNQAGRAENAELRLPEGVRYRQEKERTLEEMLIAGDLDAILAPRPPAGFLAGQRTVRRLVEQPRAAEEAYYRETGIFPIMHTIALRGSVVERHPWVPLNLIAAFEKAKQNCYLRIGDATASRLPLPWAHEPLQNARELMGDDPWPYGIEPNRKNLQAFLDYCLEQGVCHRPVTVEELFPKQVSAVFRV